MRSLAAEGLGDIAGLLPAGFGGPMFAMFGAAPGGSAGIAPCELGLARLASSNFANWSSSPPISGLSAEPPVMKGSLGPPTLDPGPDPFPPGPPFGALPPGVPFGSLPPSFAPFPLEPPLPPLPLPDRVFEDEETMLDDDDLVDLPLPSFALPEFELRLEPLESFRLELLRSLPNPEPLLPLPVLPCLLPDDLPLAADPAADDERELPDPPLIILAASYSSP